MSYKDYAGPSLVRGDLLRTLRHNRGFPAGLLAYLVYSSNPLDSGIHPSAEVTAEWGDDILVIESERRSPTWRTIWKIARALQVAPDDFLRYPLAHGRGERGAKLHL